MKDYKLRDLILISMLAVLSIITKPFIKTISFSVTSMYGLPGGIIGGIFYMMWLSLIFRVTGRKYSVILFSILQAILAMTMIGASIHMAVVFVASGIGAEIILHLIKNNELAGNMLSGAIANTIGSLAMFFLLFNKQKSPLLYGLIISFVSGSLSGLVTLFITNRLRQIGLIKSPRPQTN